MKGDKLEDGVKTNSRNSSRYVLFDLAVDSLLEPISFPKKRFRVTSYDPEMLSKKHGPSYHQYLLCGEAFEADVILNLPKLKTHNKTGITGALKNLVGLNGNKEYLPHHRIGGAMVGGDCYRGIGILKRTAEFCLDKANKAIGTDKYHQWKSRAQYCLKLQSIFGDTDITGGWYGNDTTWRMVLDIDRLLFYGQTDSSINNDPKRMVLSLTDAIVAGSGEGPLAPTPVFSGFVTFSLSPCFADLVHSSLMLFDWKKIPLIYNSFSPFKFPLIQKNPSDCKINFNDRQLSLDELRENLGVHFEPSRGWKGHIEHRRGTR